MIKPLVIAPDERLLTPAYPVANFAKLARLLRDMRDTMKAEGGVGLAANQIGDERAVFVLDKSLGVRPLTFVNPEIVSVSDELVTDLEGCLSVPDVELAVPRAQSVTVKAVDEHNRPFTITVEGYAARAVLHEIDHLNGELFTRLA